MKKLLLALALLLAPSAALAQCNGIFPNNTACGNVTGASNTPRAIPLTSFPANAPGGTTGQIQYNAGSSLFGGFTASGDATINTTTGAVVVSKTNGVAFGPPATGTSSGNTTKFATVNGSLTSGDGVKIDANGNLIDTGITSAPGFSGASICNLTNAMNTHYGVGGWTHYTGIGLGTDIGPAMQDCISSFSGNANGGIGTIYVPAAGGSWMLRTNGIDFSGITIVGDYSLTPIIYNPTTPNTTAFAWRGTGGLSGGGIQNISLLLDGGLGATGNSALIFSGNSTFQPDESNISHVYVTSSGGTSTWNTCLLYNGSARTVPQGIRIAILTDVQLFECTNIGATFNNVVQFSINNLGIYVSTGTGQNFTVAGSGTALTNTTQIIADNIEVSGDTNVTNTSKIFIRGWSNTITVNTTTTHGVIQMVATPSGTCGTGCTVTTF